MADFTLDTSGVITIPSGPYAGDWTWDRLNLFTRGFIRAGFEAGVAHDCDGFLYPELDGTAFHMLAPASLERIMADCEAVLAEFKPPHPDAELGEAFWRGRNQIGPGNEFNKAAFPPITFVLTDDGKVEVTS